MRRRRPLLAGQQGARQSRGMLDLKSLADRLGLSHDQTSRLVQSLRDVLQGHVQRGRYNRIEVHAGAIPMLERARDLHQRGTSYADLPSEIEAEMTDNAQADGANEISSPPAERRPTACAACESKDELIAQLRDDLQRERERADRYERLALPNPDGRPWWQRLLGLSGSRSARG